MTCIARSGLLPRAWGFVKYYIIDELGRLSFAVPSESKPFVASFVVSQPARCPGSDSCTLLDTSVSHNSVSGTIWPFRRAENKFALLANVPKIEGEILLVLQWLPRSHPIRPTLLYVLAQLRTPRSESLNQRSNLDKAITHLTEAVLLTSTQHIVTFLFHLAVLLITRFSHYERHDDIKSSIKYLRFLRINFRSLEAFNIPHAYGDLPTNLFHALALNLVLTRLTPGEMAQDLAEMVPLIPEFITVTILTHQQKLAIKAFSEAFNTVNTEILRQEDTQVVDRAIQALREATILNQDLWVAHALAMCLAFRFERTSVMKDCEEAIANFDRIVATFSGNSLTEMQDATMGRMTLLLLFRINLSPGPEYLEDGIHRLRAFVPYSSSDKVRAKLTETLEAFTQRRLKYFGVTGNSGGTPLNPYTIVASFYTPHRSPDQSQIQKKIEHLGDVTFAIMEGKITDVEAAIEVNRKMIPLQQPLPSDQWTWASEPARMFAGILLLAVLRTRILDHLKLDHLNDYHLS